MPAFAEQKMLTEQEIGLVADWLRGEWYRPPAP
jgi:mono/diheme cytochrome c family protein